ncbi:MAG: DNA-binding protein [Deltaproteobacteria bacterium]|nr:DNA-binding protein [Deltaproteobacteria bacterium]
MTREKDDAGEGRRKRSGGLNPPSPGRPGEERRREVPEPPRVSDLVDEEEELLKQRPGGLKPRSIAKKRLTRQEMIQGKELLPYMEYRRPHTRSECRDGIRPCPYVSCRFHLYLDVNPRTGTLKLNFPGLEVWEMPFTCALDVSDMGGRTLEEVGQILNMTRERVRQLEASALRKIRTAIERSGEDADLLDGSSEEEGGEEE